MTCQRARAQGSRRGGFSNLLSRCVVVPRLGDGHPDPSTCGLPTTHRTHTAAASVTLKRTPHTLHVRLLTVSTRVLTHSPHTCSPARATHGKHVHTWPHTRGCPGAPAHTGHAVTHIHLPFGDKLALDTGRPPACPTDSLCHPGPGQPRRPLLRGP